MTTDLPRFDTQISGEIMNLVDRICEQSTAFALALTEEVEREVHEDDDPEAQERLA